MRGQAPKEANESRIGKDMSYPLAIKVAGCR